MSHPTGLSRVPRVPADKRALVAVDLGAESCRISLLQWTDDTPRLTLVHRFPNGPLERDGLRWPLHEIEQGVDEGLRRCAELASEGIRSIAVDGWAVDYVRLDANGGPLAEPFCYRDERTVVAQDEVYRRISAQRIREITGVQLARINTLYQLCADAAAGLPAGVRWLNLPEYMLTRWGAEPVAEYTNATHSQMIDLRTRRWSEEIFAAAGLDIGLAPRLVEPGTHLGKMRGALAGLPPFRDTDLIAPACHDTASAIAGIALDTSDWAYISSGTWSLVGALLPQPNTSPVALKENFTNLGAVGGRICFHKGLNGMWILKQCIESWDAAGQLWNVTDLIAAAQDYPRPEALLDINDPELLLMGQMPQRINRQLHKRGLPALNESPAAAPEMASLILHSLAAEYARTLDRLEEHIGRRLQRVVVVGGGSRNDLLCGHLAGLTGRTVVRGSAESSTLGNLAVQLAAGEKSSGERLAAETAVWASILTGAE